MEDLSVIGYADFSFAPELVPPLTSVRQDPYLIGKTAARLLLDRILDRRRSAAPRRVHVNPELVLRGSTSPVG